jgi:beta-lactamase class A
MNNILLNRRQLGLLAGALALGTRTASGAPAALPRAAVQQALQALERRAGGRLGVAVHATASGPAWGHRSDERFALCSTFKLPLAGAVLQAVAQGRLAGDRWMPYTAAQLLPHSPITGENAARGGMTVLALAEATQTTSDNLAANLLLQLLGGPAGLTAWLREGGDAHTRIDRVEPEMNRVLPGEVRDTTTPAAMAGTAWQLALGERLPAASRERLVGWMVATETGQRRLRAGLPKAWRAGDKTGTGSGEGMPDKYNDVAVIWPPGRAPLTVAAYYDSRHVNSPRMRAEDEAVLAEVGRLVARWDGA